MRHTDTWRSLAALLLLLQVGMAYADEVTELGEDFLAYLGSLEDSNDNWTDLVASNAAAVKQSSSTAVKQQASASSSSNATSNSDDSKVQR
jgi:hypothetical protein